MRFSERQGFRSARSALQIDSMDDGLRNRLWSVLLTQCWSAVPKNNVYLRGIPELYDFAYRLWNRFFKKPVDSVPTLCPDFMRAIRLFYFAAAWHDAYDFLEFVVGDPAYQHFSKELASACNEVLEQELSGYRFIGGTLAPISGEEQVAAIERAAAGTFGPYPGASKHLRTAVELLAKRPAPDYRNSIKEAISAVESVCIAITGESKATLGAALRVIGDHAELHGALRGAFDKLYGYTSDEQGIRHALLDEDKLEQEDAVFMLVACSAFVSYVIAKRARKP